MNLKPFVIPIITMGLVTTALTIQLLFHENTNEIKTLYSDKITKENSAHLKGIINHDNINEVISNISKNNIKYLLITSGGGNVEPGLNLLNLLQTRQDIICISDLAESMAFTILQSCGVRLATDSAIFMTHKAYIINEVNALESLKPSQILEIRKDVENLNIELSKFNSERMGISYLFYTYKLEQGDWEFTNKKDIMYYNVVDGFYPNKISTFERK